MSFISRYYLLSSTELNWEEWDAYLEIKQSNAMVQETNTSDHEDNSYQDASFDEEHGEVSHAGGKHEVFRNVVEELDAPGHQHWYHS